MHETGSLKTVGNGLAAALAIATSTSAYGTIVLVNPPADLTNVPGGANTAANWDVNGDGINDFRFTDRYPNTAQGGYGVIWQMNMNPAVGTESTNGLISYDGSFVRYAYALGFGTIIGPGDPRFSTQAQVVLGSKYSYGNAGVNYYGGFAAGGPNGSVTPGTYAFAGFRFQAADGTHYGWIRLRVNAGVIDFSDAGYESTPNASIIPILEPPIPEPGTLALLAFGAVGVIGTVTKRRRG
jgi:hypothetical protein